MVIRMSEVPTKKRKNEDDVIAANSSPTDHTGFASASDELQPYTFRPLESADTVRLLCLYPSEIRSTPLSGFLVHVSRDAELTRPTAYSKYAAVSYAWGAADFSHHLLLRDDVFHLGQCVSITPEVANMLTELRKPYKLRHLWIDAICLDQHNDVEKSQQIPLMGEIYSQACKVIFWLGMESDGEVGKLFTYFRHLVLRPERCRGTAEIDNIHEARQHLHQFFQRPWFFRRWILQEMICARHGALQCGSHTLPWSLFRVACSTIRTIEALFDPTNYGIAIINAISQEERNLSSLLWRFHQSACSDEKDRIAALYGLLPRDMQEPLNYQMPYQEMYRKHAIVMLDYPSPHELIRHLFSFGALSYPSDPAWPSWVPNWSAERSASIPLFFPNSIHIPGSDGGGQWTFGSAVHPRYSVWKQKRRQLDGERDRSEQDWQMWRKWLLTTDCSLDQATVLSVRKDHYGEAVLNLSWISTWHYPRKHKLHCQGFSQGDAYGRPISRVATFPNPCDWPDIVQRFAHFREGFKTDKVSWPQSVPDSRSRYMDTPVLQNLGRLAIVLEKLLSWQSSRTLSRWKEPKKRRSILTCALYLLFEKPNRSAVSFTHILHDMDIKGDRPTIQFLENFVPNTEEVSSKYLKEIICELCMSLHTQDLAIGELCYEEDSGQLPFKTYFIGPSTIEKGMVLVPLHTIDSAHQDWFEFTDSGLSYNWANGMVVKLIEDDTTSNPRYKGVKHEKCSSVSPRKAKYVTLCVIPLFKPTFVHLFSERTLVDWKDLAQEKYFDAEQNGLPPPFTIDLV